MHFLPGAQTPFGICEEVLSQFAILLSHKSFVCGVFVNSFGTTIRDKKKNKIKIAI